MSLETEQTNSTPKRDEDQLTQDDVFEILRNQRRRFVLHALKRSEEPLTVSDLSTCITAWEQGVDPENVVHEDRRHVHSALRRTHLPKLDGLDIVDYDPETNVVEPTETLSDLDIYFEVLQNREIPWSVYYTGLAAVSISLTIAVLLDVPGFAVLAPMDVGVFVVVAFGTSALIHYMIGERMRLGNRKAPPELYR